MAPDSRAAIGLHDVLIVATLAAVSVLYEFRFVVTTIVKSHSGLVSQDGLLAATMAAFTGSGPMIGQLAFIEKLCMCVSVSRCTCI